jgi:hypothetical protein
LSEFVREGSWWTILPNCIRKCCWWSILSEFVREGSWWTILPNCIRKCCWWSILSEFVREGSWWTILPNCIRKCSWWWTILYLVDFTNILKAAFQKMISLYCKRRHTQNVSNKSFLCNFSQKNC